MTHITQAMILAAGLGSRMGSLTQDIPKPMLPVDGISLIERHLIYLHNNNIKKIVINTHYKAEIFEDFVKSLPISSKLDIYFSREKELLGTAGGVKKALNILGKEPFFIINSDAIYVDSDNGPTALSQLEKNWNPEIMSILILLSAKDKAFGYYGKGDFDINQKGQIKLNKEAGEFIHAGMKITDYRAFKNYPDKIIQFYPTIYMDILSEGKLFGSIYQGDWLHIGDNKAYNVYHSK